MLLHNQQQFQAENKAVIHNLKGNGYPVLNQDLQNHDAVGQHIPV